MELSTYLKYLLMLMVLIKVTVGNDVFNQLLIVFCNNRKIMKLNVDSELLSADVPGIHSMA